MIVSMRYKKYYNNMVSYNIFVEEYSELEFHLNSLGQSMSPRLFRDEFIKKLTNRELEQFLYEEEINLQKSNIHPEYYA